MSRPNRLKRWRLLLVPLALALGCRGCSEPPVEQGMTLTEAADEATFASVEKLGPHRCLSSIVRTDSRDGVAGASHTEVAEIAWRSWDRFRVTRVMDGQPVSDAIVVGGKPWARSYQGPWEAREDAETFRVQLQATWDSWDPAMEPFGERVAFTASSLPKKKKKKKVAHRSGFTPVALSGAVWLDEQSAVRLLASVEGQVSQGNLVRSIQLKLTRSDFGEDLNIDPPPKEALAKPEEAPAPAALPTGRTKKPTGR